MNPETTEELLSRLEREHVQQGHLCVGCWDAGTDDYWLPCDVARLVAHARSLEAALLDLADLQNGPPLIRDTDEWDAVMDRTWKLLGRAALGEAQ